MLQENFPLKKSAVSRKLGNVKFDMIVSIVCITSVSFPEKMPYCVLSVLLVFHFRRRCRIVYIREIPWCIRD